MRVLLRSVLAIVVLGLFACSPNKLATEKCKTKVDGSGECQKCCHEHGASGYKYVSGDSCSCLN
jgi:hypothetical protein